MQNCPKKTLFPWCKQKRGHFARPTKQKPLSQSNKTENNNIGATAAVPQHTKMFTCGQTGEKLGKEYAKRRAFGRKQCGEGGRRKKATFCLMLFFVRFFLFSLSFFGHLLKRGKRGNNKTQMVFVFSLEGLFGKGSEKLILG